MDTNDQAWQREIDRRAAVYDELDARGAWRGAMGAVDYLALLALTVVLVVGFWVWG